MVWDSQTKRKRVLSIIGGGIGFIAAYLLVKLLFAPSFESAGKEFVDRMNKGCPIIVDEFTQLDSLTIPKGSHIIRYHYTISGIDDENISLEEAQQRLKKVAIDNFKAAPDLKAMRDNSVIFDLVYFDKGRKKIMEINIVPSDYK